MLSDNLILYHGTSRSINPIDITVDNNLKGLYLTDNYKSALDYGQNAVFAFRVLDTASVLNISDPDIFLNWLFENGVFCDEERANGDLLEYARSGQLFQYDISSRTRYQDDVVATAKSQGIDLIIVPDNLGNGNSHAFIATSMQKLEPMRYYNSHGVVMPWKSAKELELERDNYTLEEFEQWERIYGLKDSSPVIWITPDPLVAGSYAVEPEWLARYHNESAEKQKEMAHGVDIYEITGSRNQIISESFDGDDGYLMVLSPGFGIQAHVLSDCIFEKKIAYFEKTHGFAPIVSELDRDIF